MPKLITWKSSSISLSFRNTYLRIEAAKNSQNIIFGEQDLFFMLS